MKRHAPAAERNRAPILDVLRRELTHAGWVLEVASGTGQHAVHFAAALPHLTWQPSDADPTARASIAAWIAELALPNVAAPWALDVTDPSWAAWVRQQRTEAPTAIFCANMIHIAPWEACIGLFAGAAELLDADGPLLLYGPFRFDGQFTADSNAAFDRSLRASDPTWGVRDLDDLRSLARKHHMTLAQTIAMPANNHTLVFRRDDR
jgi:hypothetical protein